TSPVRGRVSAFHAGPSAAAVSTDGHGDTALRSGSRRREGDSARRGKNSFTRGVDLYGARGRDRAGNTLHLCVRHLRINRQRQHLTGGGFSDGKIARLVSKVFVRWLKMDRNRVMDACLNSFPA